MEKLKDAWKSMTKFEKTMISVRDMACFCAIVTALLTVLGLVPQGAVIAVMLPIAALAQAALSWKRSRGTALFFLAFLVFFFFVFFISKG